MGVSVIDVSEIMLGACSVIGCWTQGLSPHWRDFICIELLVHLCSKPVISQPSVGASQTTACGHVAPGLWQSLKYLPSGPLWKKDGGPWSKELQLAFGP